MKILMFGWEFPPHISGGLGTACYGLTKGLAEINDTEITFVVPKVFGDEDHNIVKLVGANKIPVSQKEYFYRESGRHIDMIEVQSNIIPYVDEKEFYKLTLQRHDPNSRFIMVNDDSCIDFSGGYGLNLFSEINNYALIADIIAKSSKFDLIHAHDWLTYPAGIASKKATGKPLIVHVHATEFDRSGGDINPSVYAIERHGFEEADKIIAVSNFTKQTIIDKYGVQPEKIITVYNAVESIDSSKNLFTKKDDNEKLVVFLGRITLQKGPEYFIEAASLVLKNMDNVRFVMAGSGDKMNEMIRRVAELGMSDRFHFTGFLKSDDVAEIFNVADVFVMPSVSEPFGIVPLEAMQSGVPVIISNQSGVSEVIKHAVKIDFWDTYAMADAIFGLLNYKELSGYLRTAGKEEVEKLSWDQVAMRVKEIYSQMLNNQ